MTGVVVKNGSGDQKLTNSLGIPGAEFVDDIDEYMKRPENESDATGVIKKLDETHSKYRFMELNLMQKKRRLKRQIPDIKSSLDMLKMIRYKKDNGETMDTNFLLSDQVYVDANIPPTDKIYLWLGANVMLEYSLDEAEKLLSKNRDTAIRNLAQIDIDLDYLRDQITTTEVNMARAYNWDVKRRQAEKK
ncbi:Prefoldin subunit 3 [Halotydeus destructor]|nr:Prefoldin subunit 3 [Halotydeus destructor]